MLATTDIILQRQIALRTEGFALAEEMERAGRLDFNLIRSDCGTYRCLLGWWYETEYANNDPEWLADASGDYFDLTAQDWYKLFGIASCGTLADRRAYLDKLIEARMAIVVAA
jgi:hypothetical protein